MEYQIPHIDKMVFDGMLGTLQDYTEEMNMKKEFEYNDVCWKQKPCDAILAFVF